MRRRSIPIRAAFLVGCALACGIPFDHWEVGGIYSISNGDGSFGVVKVLATEPDAISTRIYKPSHVSRPTQLVPSDLSLGSVDDEDGFGIGHLPIAPREFAVWFPVLIRAGGVSEEELEGHRLWKESGGGVFDFGLLEGLEDPSASDQEGSRDE